MANPIEYEGYHKSQAQAYKFIAARVAKDTTIQADEAGSWDKLHALR
jgi:hypothetical protein